MREVTGATTRPYVSFSQLAVAADCGEAYRRKYIEGEPTDQTNIYALFGSAFHEGAELFETAHQEFYDKYDDHLDEEKEYFWEAAPERMVPMVKQAMRTQMDEHGIDPDDLVYYGKQDLEFFYREKIPKSCISYAAFRHDEMRIGVRPYSTVPTEWLEVQCSTEVGEFPTLAVIDQVLHDRHGRVVLRDLKTGEPKSKDATQLQVYRLAFERATGIKADYGQLLYLKREKPFVQVVKFDLNDDNTDEMVRRLRTSVGDPSSLLINGPFNGHCQVCDFKADCPWSAIKVRGTS